MTNILEAIFNIVNRPVYEVKNYNSGKKRVNSVGESLENYIKDAFANTFDCDDESVRLKKFNTVFSWLGNQNHPPDIIIKGGDAIEVKKTESSLSDLALNSSYPKANLSSSSPMITHECKHCEEWTEKDLIYCIGHTTKDTIKSLWLVYGSIYAAKFSIYERIKQTISNGITSITDVEFAETNELGRVNRVDPLGITNLRIRGMWQIQNPRRVFGYLHQQTNCDFELVCIIPLDKYNSFDVESIQQLESIASPNFSIKDVEVKDPNNPANLIPVKLILFSVK